MDYNAACNSALASRLCVLLALEMATPMDAISGEALTALNTTIQMIFAGVSPTPTIEIIPLKVVPAGLGGYIGLHHAPEGDIVARRIDATVRVSVTSGNQNTLNAAVLDINQRILGMTRAERLAVGLQQVKVVPIISDTPPSNTRVLAFAINYEFVKNPTEAGDIIQQIPVTLTAQLPTASGDGLQEVTTQFTITA
jgi:hypothetical protein